ncbi:hypothetical protein Pcinc_005811 [Petrolisthes cinctipes]|nr:hypothetical protein Pcinc_005811 [Petrolisthes cinctipes]
MDTTSPTLMIQAPTEVQPPHLNTNDVTQSHTTQLNITQEAHGDDTRPPEVQSLSNDVLQSTCTPTITQPPPTGTATAPDIDVNWTSLTDDSRILRVFNSPVSQNDDTHQLPHLHDISDAEETQLHRISKDLETIKSHLKTKDNEIELLNMEVKSAFTVIGLLQQRISELEQGNGNSRQCEVATNVPTPSFCLLLGDTNFRRVLRSDLDDNCSVKTIVKANMDLLRSWASEKLQAIPSECILYGGLYDILAEKAPENILDCLGSLISDLKVKNSEMKIYVCQVVPLPEFPEIASRISDYNEQLSKWGDRNGVNIVKTPPEFILGTGNVDELCFDVEDDTSCILNRLGVIRLLNTFKKQCPGFSLCKNWENVRRRSSTSYNVRMRKVDQSAQQRGEHHQRQGRAYNTHSSMANVHTPPPPLPLLHSQAILPSPLPPPSPLPHPSPLLHPNITHPLNSYTHPLHGTSPRLHNTATQRFPLRPAPPIVQRQNYHGTHSVPVRRVSPHSYGAAVQSNPPCSMEEEPQTRREVLRNEQYASTPLDRHETEHRARATVIYPHQRHAPHTSHLTPLYTGHVYAHK